MTKLVKSFQWATNGILITWREEVNFQIEILLGFGVVMLGKYLHFTKLEWIIIVGCIGAVLAAEMVNTAIEDLCNRVEPKYDSAIKKIKDIMGGFVLIIVITSVTVGLMVFSSYF